MKINTNKAVLVVHNDIVSAINQGHVLALVLLDLSSAFDTVDHPTLLSLLQDRFAVSDHALAWFHYYLTNRTQTFTTSSSHTVPLLLACGVPQGSGLGPTSFLTYTEDFPFIHFYITCMPMMHRPMVIVSPLTFQLL